MGTLQQEYDALRTDHAECHKLLNAAGETEPGGRLAGRLRRLLAKHSDANRILNTSGQRLYVLESENERLREKVSESSS